MLGALNHPIVAPAPLGLLVLIVFLLFLSTAMFVWQVRRWTTHRGWRTLLDWSREQGFDLSAADGPATEPLDRIAGGKARIVTQLHCEAFALMQVRAGGEEIEPKRWHVLRQRIATSWPATGLRPAGAAASLIDQFNLSAYPRMGDSERFTIFGEDTRAARALSQSPARALLPRDIGVLLHGSYLLLDFSTRPFDGIELGRMLALAKQIEGRLPVG